MRRLKQDTSLWLDYTLCRFYWLGIFETARIPMGGQSTELEAVVRRAIGWLPDGRTAMLGARVQRIGPRQYRIQIQAELQRRGLESVWRAIAKWGDVRLVTARTSSPAWPSLDEVSIEAQRIVGAVRRKVGRFLRRDGLFESEDAVLHRVGTAFQCFGRQVDHERVALVKPEGKTVSETAACDSSAPRWDGGRGRDMIEDCQGAGTRVRRALRRRGRSRSDADDLVREAYLRLMRFGRHQVIDRPDAFLTTTAFGRSIDDHRARVERGDGVLVDERMAVDGAPCLDDVASSKERLARLGQCMSHLPETTRAIVMAHRVDGMTYEEIGHLYGLSIRGVERQIARALLQISTWMTGGDA